MLAEGFRVSGYSSGESADACSERLVKSARKPHKCSACHGDIRKGDRYSYTAFVFEGEVETIKRCLRCEYIYQTLRNDLGAGRISDEDTDYIEPRLDCGHRYEDTHAEPMPDHLARVAFMTLDEIQALDFGEIEREREKLRMQRDLDFWRKQEVFWRGRRYWSAQGVEADFEQAARSNAKTCELERKLEALGG